MPRTKTSPSQGGPNKDQKPNQDLQKKRKQNELSKNFKEKLDLNENNKTEAFFHPEHEVFDFSSEFEQNINDYLLEHIFDHLNVEFTIVLPFVNRRWNFIFKSWKKRQSQQKKLAIKNSVENAFDNPAYESNLILWAFQNGSKPKQCMYLSPNFLKRLRIAFERNDEELLEELSTPMWRVQNARYGMRGSYVDATDTINAMIASGNRTIKASNTVFGDPIFGVVKQLTMTVVHKNGKKERVDIPEEGIYTLQ